MVAMRVCVKCMLSSAIRHMARKERRTSFVSCFAIRYISGTIRTPISVPMKRQPNRVMPNRSMPTPISTLPSCGCVYS